jgi:agmatine/peptidylarginine deiminase
MKKPVIIAALVIVAILVLIIANSKKNITNSYTDIMVNQYAPNSIAYFICKSEGNKEDNACGKCEKLYQETTLKKVELKITNDLELIAYVMSQNKDCVNQAQGGN